MMKEEPRFLKGNHIYRIDTIFHRITQVGNADNKMPISALKKNPHSYDLWIDPVSGKLLSENQEAHAAAVSIPRTVLEDGYAECTKFAQNFNKSLSEKFGIRLVDESVMKEMEDMIIPLAQPNLPIVEQGGFKFEIDVSLQEIRDVERPFVHVNVNLLKQENGQYIAYISDDGRLLPMREKGSRKIEFDQLVKLDPENMAKMYGLPKNQLPSTDVQLRSNPELLRDRIEKGKLPVIRIVDEDFFVDTRLQELRSCNKFWKTIRLPGNFQLSVIEDKSILDDKQVFLYDYLHRNIIKDFNELNEIPKHAQFIVLPDIRALDPVAAGRKMYGDPYRLLDKYPIQPKMEARLVPIEKTYLLELIKNNKKKMLADKNSIKQPVKNNRKNKGLTF
ncbi:hypothetical protein [Sphingobacterium faecium]|uniref:hypothetical protein n=1 Tax=Sphingobacterium faecium TaxID=34087 RepID=UPI00320A28ED